MNRPEDFRKVTFKKYYSPENDYVKQIVEKEGYFHRWADEFVICENQPMKVVVGIIEDKEGNIYRVPIDRVKFQPLETLTEELTRLMNDKTL